MFFVLSKLLYFLLVPYHWVLLLALLWWRLRPGRWKTRVGWAAISIGLLFSNGYLYGLVLQAWQPPVQPQQHSRVYPVGILLGGITYADTTNQRYFGTTADRFIQAALLYHGGTIRQVLITGGDASLRQNKGSEASFLRQQLLQLHVPDSAILTDLAAKNTYENAQASKALLAARGITDTCLLITSAMHMPRSLAVFTKAGVPVRPHTADYAIINGGFSWHALLVPDLSLLSSWQYLLKEMVGLQVYRWTGKA